MAIADGDFLAEMWRSSARQLQGVEAHVVNCLIRRYGSASEIELLDDTGLSAPAYRLTRQSLIRSGWLKAKRGPGRRVCFNSDSGEMDAGLFAPAIPVEQWKENQYYGPLALAFERGMSIVLGRPLAIKICAHEGKRHARGWGSCPDARGYLRNDTGQLVTTSPAVTVEFKRAPVADAQAIYVAHNQMRVEGARAACVVIGAFSCTHVATLRKKMPAMIQRGMELGVGILVVSPGEQGLRWTVLLRPRCSV
ncbi:MAG: hypothetical protein Q8Q80_19060 [Methyloversatilis sp.]|uniref:hypothetical protein n=1 Tax=Methyloversatilis sp. TaxID=2569862 RepID=UPI002732CDA5|nr:hypothetical protein [Methyloversatilis sp.]MDP3874766.1 hypothetical protein [Methyloversatilis sp.]